MVHHGAGTLCSLSRVCNLLVDAFGRSACAIFLSTPLTERNTKRVQDCTARADLGEEEQGKEKGRDHGDDAEDPATSVTRRPLCHSDVRHLVVSEERLLRFEKMVGDAYHLRDDKEPPKGIELGLALRALRRDVLLLGQLPAFHEPIDDVVFGRLLVASDFDAEKATALVRLYVAWRQEVQGAVPPDKLSIRRCPVLIHFEDRLGRPVLFVQMRYMRPKLLNENDVEALYRSVVDASIVHLLLRRTENFSDHNPLEQYLFIIDATGATWDNVSLKFFQVLAREGNLHYPERLRQVVVLGCSAKARYLWGIVSGMLHPRTRKKVQLVSPAETKHVMQHFVDPRLLPPEYGGSGARWPAPSQAQGLDEQVGRLAASTWRRLGVKDLS